MTQVTLALDWQEQRRRQGIPTVSVLVGPVATGGMVWRRWAVQQQRAVVAVSEPFLIAQQWLRSTAAQQNLPRLILEQLARRLGRDPVAFRADWQHKTPYERRSLWESLPSTGVPPIFATCCELPTLTEQSTDLLVTRLLDAAPHDPIGVVEQVFQLLHAAGVVERSPTVLLQPAALHCTPDWFSQAAAQAGRWALQLPALSLGLVVPSGLWQQFLVECSSARLVDVLREGVVDLSLPTSYEIAQRLRHADPEAPTSAAIRLLAEQGADHGLVEMACQLLATDKATTADASSRSRSLAEQFLYDFLQLLPETAGRWELNALLNFHFGHRPIEVDLLERSRRLVVEIDGYYHFRDKEVYRRDRTKDYLLQKHGYFVLRFLAEDVVCSLELIRDRILDVYESLPVRVEA